MTDTLTEMVRQTETKKATEAIHLEEEKEIDKDKLAYTEDHTEKVKEAIHYKGERLRWWRSRQERGGA